MKIVLLFTVLLVIVFTVIYRNGYYWSNIIEPAKKIYIPETISIVNTGSTFAKYDFDYQMMKINGLNLALESQYFIDDWKMLKSHEDMIPEKTPVIITLAPGIFNLEKNMNKNYLDKYYFAVKKEYIENYSFIRKIILFSPLSWIVNISGLKSSIMEYGKKLIKRNRHVVTKQELAKNRVEVWKEQFQMDISGVCELSFNQNVIFEKTRAGLESIIELCMQNKWNPYLLIIPITIYERELLSDSYKEQSMYENIRIANRYHIPVFDYWQDTDYDNDELFFNADCLNQKGRKKFLTELMLKLKNYEVEAQN